MGKANTSVPKLRLVRPGGGRRKVIVVALLVAAVVWIVKDPSGAAAFFITVFNGLVTFFRSLG